MPKILLSAIKTINSRCGEGYFWQSALTALSFAGFIVFVLPIQSFLGNQTMFDFGFNRLFGECLMYSFAIFVAVWMLLLFLGMVLWRLPLVLLSTVLICLYLETGILSAALPPINGDLHILENAYQKVIDTAVWGVLIFASVVMYKWTKQFMHWAAMVVLVMGVASIFDVRVDEFHSNESEFKEGLCEKYEVVKSVEYSPLRNILVFVLDSLPAGVAADVVNADENLKKQYQGFVAYRNNIGMHEGTLRGLPGLMTGKYFQKMDSSFENTMTIFGKDSVLYPCFKNNTPAFFSGALFDYGYTNRKKNGIISKAEPESKPCSVFLRKTNDTPYLNLYEILVYRAMPFARKQHVLSLAIQKNKIAPGVADEKRVFTMLAEAGISQEEVTTVGVFHTHGAHSPLRKKDGTPRAGVEDVEGIYESAYYILAELGRLFDVLKEKGIYDKSFIAVTADHGSPVMSDNSEEMGAASAALMLKPIGAQAEFIVSNMSTSHSKIASLLKRAYVEDVPAEEIAKMLYTEKRVFRGRPNRTMHFYDWIYDQNGKIIEKNDLGIFTCK